MGLPWTLEPSKAQKAKEGKCLFLIISTFQARQGRTANSSALVTSHFTKAISWLIVY